jgi:hypothetical protein
MREDPFFLQPSTSFVMFFHHLCAALSGGGGRDVVLSLLPSFPPSSVVVFTLFSITDPILFLSFLPLSSNIVFIPFLDHLAPPVVALHPQQTCRLQLFSGYLIWLFKIQMCRPLIFHNSNTPHQCLHQPLSFLPLMTSSCSSHQALPCGPHALACELHPPPHVL